MLLAAFLLGAGLLAGCGVPQDAAPRALDPAKAPAGALPSPSTLPEPVGDDRVALYFVRDGQLVPVTRPVPQVTSVEPLLELLFAGPTRPEQEAGATSLIPSGLSVEKVERQDGTVVVTLKGTQDDQSRPQVLAFAQIVATLTPERASGVRFRLDGADLPVPRGDGSLTDAPVSRSDYVNLLGDGYVNLLGDGPSPAPPPATPS